MKLLLIVFAACVMITGGVSTLSAQDAVPELVTDRPDQTESSVTVPTGMMQLESGITHTYAGGGMTEAPSTLFRIGVHDRVELRLGFSGWTFAEGVDGIFGDSEIGAKLYLWEESGILPETALLGGVAVPTSNAPSAADTFDPAARIAISHGISETMGWGANLGYERETIDTGVGTTTLESSPYSIALGIGISDRLGAYVESFGSLGISDGVDNAHLANGGVTYLLQPNLQLDVEGGFGLNDAADDWFVGCGVSWRYPE